MPVTKKSVLVDLGDICAPKGTPSWCIGVRDEARSAITSTKTTREQARAWVNALHENNHYQRLADKDGRRFLSWELFCETPPPYGFGCSSDELERLVEAKPLAQKLAADPEVTAMPTVAEAMKGNQNACKDERENRNAVGKAVSSVGSNQAEYLVRRLKRDAPEIAKQLAEGKYKSARAAAIVAGIIRIPTPLDLLKRAWRNASKTERVAFNEWVATEEGST